MNRVMGPRLRRFAIGGGLLLAATVAGIVGVRYWRAMRLKRFGVVVPGVLYRGPQPYGPQWCVLGRWQIRTVVNLCLFGEGSTEQEERQACADAGARLVRIPVSGGLPSDDQIADFLQLVRGSDGPVLVHCQHGRARTGIMVAAYRVVVDGWSVDRAVAEKASYGHRPDEAEGREELRLLRRFEQARDGWLRRTVPAPASRPMSAEF